MSQAGRFFNIWKFHLFNFSSNQTFTHASPPYVPQVIHLKNLKSQASLEKYIHSFLVYFLLAFKIHAASAACLICIFCFFRFMIKVNSSISNWCKKLLQIIFIFWLCLLTLWSLLWRTYYFLIWLLSGKNLR